MLKLSEKSNIKTDTKILLDAISKDKMHLARFILDALDGKIVDSRSDGELTPLISSVFLPDLRSRAKFMNLLLQRGANVNQQDECGRTALSYACEKGYLDAVKLLVKNNADPEMVDTWGNTALMYAAVAGHSLVVEFLVRAFKRLGLQIDRQNKVGNSAVEVAKYLGHTECLSALMCSSKKAHDPDALDERFAILRTGESDDTNPKNEEKTSEVSETHQRKTSSRRKYPNLWSKMMSMDSIEELERENDCEKDRWSPSPQGSAFSRVLTPNPSQRVHVSQNVKQVAESCLSRHLPALHRGAEPHSPASPRTPKVHAHGTGDLSSPLGILLTPIRNATSTPDKEDVTAMRFDDSYYRKRCSLPTSALGPAPSERQLLKHARKGKPGPKDVTSPPHVDTGDSPTTAFSVLGNRLLRRFTLPELKKSGKETRERFGAHGGETTVRGIPRSETFPLSTNHPQVGSKPSIDSISAVKCEFDFQLKANF